MSSGRDEDIILLGAETSRFSSLNASVIHVTGGDGRDTIEILDNLSDTDARPYAEIQL